MEQLLAQIESFRKEIEGYKITNAKELEEFRIKFLGTRSITKTLFGEMKNVPGEKKKEFGQVLNEFKQFAETKFENARAATANGQETVEEKIDLSLPGDPVEIATR